MGIQPLNATRSEGACETEDNEKLVKVEKLD
jgi:hypothetical protein